MVTQVKEEYVDSLRKHVLKDISKKELMMMTMTDFSSYLSKKVREYIETTMDDIEADGSQLLHIVKGEIGISNPMDPFLGSCNSTLDIDVSETRISSYEGQFKLYLKSSLFKPIK